MRSKVIALNLDIPSPEPAIDANRMIVQFTHVVIPQPVIIQDPPAIPSPGAGQPAYPKLTNSYAIQASTRLHQIPGLYPSPRSLTKSQRIRLHGRVKDQRSVKDLL